MHHTLQIYEELRSAEFSDRQASAITRAITECVDEKSLNLTTQQQTQGVKRELQDEIIEFRSEVQEEFAKIRLEFVSVRQEFVAVRAEIAALGSAIRAEMHEAISGVCSEIKSLELRMIQSIFAQGVVVVGSVVSILHFIK